MSEESGRPRYGRQAEAARNDRLVLDAAREVFATQGEAATVSAIAARAGVGMGSLYRRYGSKEELLRHLCTVAMEQSIEAAEAGLAAEDPWSGLVNYIRACVSLGTGALAPLAGTIETTARMQSIARRGMRAQEELVARARRVGPLRPDVTALDIAWLIELFGRFGPMKADDTVRQRLLVIALDGLCANGTNSLPGPAPSAQQYVRRWAKK